MTSETPLLMRFSLWKISYQFLHCVLHPSPEPNLNPAVQKEPDIGRGISGDHFLLWIKTAQIQNDVFEQIDQPSLVQQALKFPIGLEMGKHDLNGFFYGKVWGLLALVHPILE